MTDSITSEEYGKFIDNMDKVIDMMEKDAEKKGYSFLIAVTVRKDNHPYQPRQARRATKNVTKIDRLGLADYIVHGPD